ncbi:MAG: TonB-dependent receptor plug domain-containing protein, partial [Kangiellaceae bacterium]|nr:TonB-dependent receptor plug domain-containing protein [Kangiellaceae bacterium]
MKTPSAVSLLCLFLPTLVSADSTINEDNLMIVTGTRVSQSLQESLDSSQIITRDDIERLQPESINDLLSAAAGLDVVTQGGGGQVSSIFARGSNSDHTLILINGARVGSATDGRKNLSTISVSQIERIEIVRGPKASVW